MSSGYYDQIVAACQNLRRIGGDNDDIVTIIENAFDLLMETQRLQNTLDKVIEDLQGLREEDVQ